MDIAALAYLVAIAFQVLLALGAPWGAYAMGGTYPGRFPPGMRVVAAVQAAVLSLLVLDRPSGTAQGSDMKISVSAGSSAWTSQMTSPAG